MNKWTTESLAAAIKKFTEDHMEKGKERDYKQEARWFVAYHLASDMRECYMNKDWAHYVLEGMQPLTETDVDEFMNPEEMTDEGDKVTPMDRKDLMVMIRSFYGITTQE